MQIGKISYLGLFNIIQLPKLRVELWFLPWLLTEQLVYVGPFCLVRDKTVK